MRSSLCPRKTIRKIPKCKKSFGERQNQGRLFTVQIFYCIVLHSKLQSCYGEEMIEQLGSGLCRIQEACKNQGLKLSLIKELNDQFRITLFSEKIEERILPKCSKNL